MDILGLVGSFWYVFMIPPLVISGLLVGVIVASPRKNQVLLADAGSNRGFLLDVVEENAFSAYCKGLADIPSQRIIKYRPPYILLRRTLFGNRLQAMWLGRNGTAYTQRVENDIKLEQTVPDYLKAVWGDEFYSKIPQGERVTIEKNSVPVTIRLAPDPLTPKDEKENELPSVSNEDIKREEDRQAAKNLWQEFKAEGKGTLVNTLLAMGAGSAATFVLLLAFGKLAS